MQQLQKMHWLLRAREMTTAMQRHIPLHTTGCSVLPQAGHQTRGRVLVTTIIQSMFPLPEQTSILPGPATAMLCPAVPLWLPEFAPVQPPLCEVIILPRALTDPLGPSVVYEDIVIADNNDSVFSSNDTLRISGVFMNYLGGTTNLTAPLRLFRGGSYGG